jgi:hypothetical protein
MRVRGREAKTLWSLRLVQFHIRINHPIRDTLRLLRDNTRLLDHHLGCKLLLSALVAAGHRRQDHLEEGKVDKASICPNHPLAPLAHLDPLNPSVGLCRLSLESLQMAPVPPRLSMAPSYPLLAISTPSLKCSVSLGHQYSASSSLVLA